MGSGVDHIHITSRDPRASARWWVATLGATPLPEQEIRTILFAPVMLGGVKISISGPRPGEAGRCGDPAPVPHYGLEHLGVTVEDLEGTLARFRAQGLAVYERREIPGFRIAFVSAPDGVVLELMEPVG